MYERKMVGYEEAAAALKTVHDHVNQEIAEGKAETTCGIAIVDPYGELVAVMRMDGAAPLNVNIAIKKAKTAAIMRRDTREQQEALKKVGCTIGEWGDFATQIPGGVCITQPGISRERKPGKKGPEIFGAIGASGRPAEGDEELSFIGLRALQKAVWGKSD